MGYVRNRMWNDMLPTSIALHLVLIASIIIAMSAYWARVNFDVRDPSWADTTPPDAKAGPFHCPTKVWFLFAYNGFCSSRELNDGSRGSSGKEDCLAWNDDTAWRKMDSQNTVGTTFNFSKDNWQATGALLGLALFLSLITLVLTSIKSLYNPWNLGISTFLLSIIFDSLLIAWILASTSDQFKPNSWDGMLGCGNSSFNWGPGYGFAVVGSALALLLFFMLLAATVAEGISRVNEDMDRVKGPGVATRIGEEKYDTRPEDRQVHGYRPDIVA